MQTAAMRARAERPCKKGEMGIAHQYSESAGSASDPQAPAEFRSHSLVLPASAAGLRLDQALARALPQYSRARLQGWIEVGAVLVDGQRPRAKDKVLGGEQVEVAARLEADHRVTPEAQPLAVVHQDRALIVIDKPAGMVVHPGAGNRSHTLQNALLALDPKLALVPRAGLVHRLDKDTSGLLVVARTPEAHARLVAAMAERAIERTYLAVCVGAMTGGGTIDAAIGRHRTQRTRMTVRSDGREAVTHYRIAKRYRAHTFVRVQLETGRTHQIRLHLAHIGYPIVGDPVYGGRRRLPAGCTPALTAALSTFPRQALHAARLALTHPMTGKPLEWEAPLPDDMARLLAALDADLKASAREIG
jgi:23S rRNA pseudouridine1911/1915/1917 synthase